MPRTTRTSMAAGMATALLATACNSGAATSVSTQEEALTAMRETISSSWELSLAYDIEITPEQVDGLFDMLGELDSDDLAMGADEVEAMRGYVDYSIDQARNSRSVIARGADNSVRFASEVEGEEVLDVRVDVADLFAMDTLTPEAGLIVKIDIPAFLDQFQQTFSSMGVDEEMPAELTDMFDVDAITQQVTTFLPDGPVQDMVLAIVDGGHGGVVGTLDLERFGVTEEDLASARDEFMAGFEREFGASEDSDVSPEAIMEMVRDAVASGVVVTDPTATDSGTTATVSIRPRDFVHAVGQFMQEAGEVDDYEADYEAEVGAPIDDLPESIDGVATLTFTGDGVLQEVRVPTIEVVRQVADAIDDAPAELDQVMAELDGARFDLVATFSQVGEVDTVMDVDATTTSWDDLIDTLEGFFGPLMGA